MGISLLNRRFNSLLHTFTPQKHCQSFNSPKPLNKTRSMVPSESKSPLLSIPQPHFFPSSHALLSQLPLFSRPCSSFFIQCSFPHLQSHISWRPDYFSTLSLTHPGLSIYLLVLWLWLRFLGAADNSGILPFTFTTQPKHGHHFWPHHFWHLSETDKCNQSGVALALPCPLHGICMYAGISVLLGYGGMCRLCATNKKQNRMNAKSRMKFLAYKVCLTLPLPQHLTSYMWHLSLSQALQLDHNK